MNTKDFIRNLNIIYFAQVMMLVAFSMVALYMYASGQLAEKTDEDNIFLYAVPVLTIVFLAAGYFIFNILISKIDSSLKLTEKLTRYQVAVIVRSALMESAGLLAAVATIITGKIFFLGATMLVLVLFLLLRPTPYGITEDLKLSSEEKNELQNL